MSGLKSSMLSRNANEGNLSIPVKSPVPSVVLNIMEVEFFLNSASFALLKWQMVHSCWPCSKKVFS
jgi:hypothetical protein